MRVLISSSLAIAFLATASASLAEDKDGWVSLFDGKTLKGWNGNPKFWSVQDGAITGKTTKENPTNGNTFIIWNGGELADFELKLQYKIVNGNSGIQYRSFKRKGSDEWRIGGYQADFEAGKTYSGILYGEAFRGILANRGEKTELSRENNKFVKKVVGSVGKSAEIQKKIKHEDWNDYYISAKGFHFVHKINGVVTSECTDNDKSQRKAKGLLALQLHAGPPMTVQFRNISVKHHKATDKQSALDSDVPTQFVSFKGEKKATKKIVLIAGRKSHGYGAHEHFAGCTLLANALNQSGLPCKAVVVRDGWPKDASVLDGASTIVIYSDGGGGHPFNAHIAALNTLTKKGVGIVCIHYGVEVPKGKSGEAFLDWTGGYFETNWSVNPHWTAKYKQFPKHEITRGVQPFSINDEWYYHMRFREKMAGVTPILTDLPPKDTLRRNDGPHSGNPFVRKEVAAGIPQHMAWARKREDGGRGFGFTGGHNHWNWGNNQFRKLVLNAIAWTAHLEVPKTGVPSKPLSVKDLEANQDYKKPANHNPARIQRLLDDWNRSTDKTAA